MCLEQRDISNLLKCRGKLSQENQDLNAKIDKQDQKIQDLTKSNEEKKKTNQFYSNI